MKRKLSYIGFCLILCSILVFLFSGCRPTGKAWSPGEEDNTVYDFISGIATDPADWKIVVGSNAKAEEIQEIAKLAGELGVTESRVVEEDNVSIDEPYLIIVGSINDKVWSNSLLEEIINSGLEGVPNTIVDNLEAKYGGLVYVDKKIPRIIVTVAGVVSKVALMMGYLRNYTYYQDELSSNVILFDKDMGIINKCKNGIRDYDESGIDCGNGCGACGVDIKVYRSLPSGVVVNSDFNVGLELTGIDESKKPDGISIEDGYPSECSFVSCDAFGGLCNPHNKRPAVVFVFFEESLKNKSFSYTINCPTEGIKKFGGNWSATENNEIISGIILGDDEVEVKGISVCRDVDGDMYSLEGGGNCCGATGNEQCNPEPDCDDNNPNINPGAEEICDGENKDEDCDGNNNEEGATGCIIYYADKDGDGAGNPTASKCLCYGIEPYDTTVDGDCDDSDAERFPGNKEICDGKDNDCNSTTLDRDLIRPCPKQAGVCSGSYERCDGEAWRGCDDSDYHEFNPNYEVNETKCDGLDNDCDGLTDPHCECKEGEEQDCALQLGVCEGCQEECIDGSWNGCSAETYKKCNPKYRIEESYKDCDLLDNDCDGVIDEECLSIYDLINNIRGKAKGKKGFKIVIGSRAMASDSVGAIDVAGITGITDIVLDNQIGNPANENIITIGGPCANKATGAIMDAPTEDFNCAINFSDKKPGIIKVYRKNGKTQMVVAGLNALDTRRAAKAIAYYNKYEGNIVGYEICVRGITLWDINFDC